MPKHSHKQFSEGEIVGRCRDQKHLSEMRGIVKEVKNNGDTIIVEWDWEHPYIREKMPHMFDGDNFSVYGRAPGIHSPAEIRKVE